MKARKIELKEVTFKDDTGTDQVAKYEEFIKVVITVGGQAGFSGDDILKAIEIKTELKSANGTLHLDEANYNWLLGRINSFRYNIASEQLADFIKDVRAAPQVEMEVPK